MVKPIEEYDQELLGDISSLEQYIVDWVSHELKSQGCPKAIADDIAKEEKETSIYARSLNGLLDLMKELVSCIKDFPFRIYLLPAVGLVDEFQEWSEIIIDASLFQFNLSVLEDDERRILLKHVKTISDTYYDCWEFYEKTERGYPSAQLMKFIQDMLMTSRREQFLTQKC